MKELPTSITPVRLALRLSHFGSTHQIDVICEGIYLHHIAGKARVTWRYVFTAAPFPQVYIVSILMAYSRSATMDGPDPSVVIFNTNLFCVPSPSIWHIPHRCQHVPVQIVQTPLHAAENNRAEPVQAYHPLLPWSLSSLCDLTLSRDSPSYPTPLRREIPLL